MEDKADLFFQLFAKNGSISKIPQYQGARDPNLLNSYFSTALEVWDQSWRLAEVNNTKGNPLGNQTERRLCCILFDILTASPN